MLIVSALAHAAGPGPAAKRTSNSTGTTASSKAMDPMSKVHPLPASLERKVQAFKADVGARGFEVSRGYWTLWGAEECKYAIKTVGICYGNNPTAPYVVAMMPPWSDEYVDQRFQQAIRQPQRNMFGTFRLGEREALVVMAQMPPSARYFGVHTNVYSRKDEFNEDDPIYEKLADIDPDFPALREVLFVTTPDPERMLLLSSIGDSVNNVVIQNKSGGELPWSAQRFFIITPDRDLAEEMTEALVKTGVDEKHVLVEPVGRDLVRLGYGAEADDFVAYLRYALPDDPDAGDAWRATLPVTVLRVRDKDGKKAVDAFEIPEYVAKAGNYNQDETLLIGKLAVLEAQVRQYWRQDRTEAPTKIFLSAYNQLDLVGQRCLGYGSPLGDNRGPMDCLGDNQDTDYQLGQSMGLDNGEVIAVLGTLATETDNATYVSLSVNRFPVLVGAANLDDADLLGSAGRFQAAAGVDVLGNDAHKFYVYYIARDCSGLQDCLEISRRMVPRGETIKLMQRNYVKPGSTVGPDPAKVLNPIGIVLNGKKRP